MAYFAIDRDRGEGKIHFRGTWVKGLSAMPIRPFYREEFTDESGKHMPGNRTYRPGSRKGNIQP
jgi:hypothetical protein